MAQEKDYYRILGVAEAATADEIKKAYRRLAKKHHPDANPGNKQAEAKFKEISEANAVLSDPDKRKQYDMMRKYGAFGGLGSRGGGGARRPPPSGAPGGQPGPGGGQYQEFDFGGGFGGLGDIFSSIFGGDRGGAERGRAEAVETTVTIPFRVAALGGKVPIVLAVEEQCPTCHGSGAAPGAKLDTCAECKGSGQVSFGYGGFAVKRPCPNCRGKGKIASQHCGTCQGAGDVKVERRLMIDVPPGTDSGTRLRLKGQGPKWPDGKAADLVVAFQVETDRFFSRDGNDVVATVPINVAQATLGTKVKVRTIDGKHVVLKVPAGTQSGKKFRIKGQGIEKNGTRGDQIVEVNVAVPEKLTPEQEAALKAFADAAGLRY